jgi:hypothetical protein
MNTMVPLMLQIMGPFLEKHVRVQVADSRAELAEKLAACGFEKASLPKCIGGNWGYEMFSQWQENRLRYEVRRRQAKDQRLAVSVLHLSLVPFSGTFL